MFFVSRFGLYCPFRHNRSLSGVIDTHRIQIALDAMATDDSVAFRLLGFQRSDTLLRAVHAQGVGALGARGDRRYLRRR